MNKDEFYIVNGEAYIEGHFIKTALRIADGKVFLCRGDAPAGAECVDASGRKIVPGFIDIHTHGAVGVDVNGAAAEDLRKIGRFFAGNGTTSWLMSVLTDTKEQTEWCIDQFKEMDPSRRDAAQLLGIHLEGPFLAKEYKGAMPEHLLKKPDAALVLDYQNRAKGNIRYMTISPEVERAVELIPELTAKENILMPVKAGKKKADMEYFRRLTQTLGIADRLSHYPAQLSGGQQQRTAIARALINRPGILLCDEPTGNLDTKSGEEVLSLLQGIQSEHGITIIMVTHDGRIASLADRVIRIEDGRICE